MTTDHSIPPLRELPTGHLAERKQHLLTEISSQRTPRFSLPGFIVSRRRIVALAAVSAACVAAVAVAASGGWLFSSHDQQVVGVTHVTLRGRLWRVTLEQQTQRDGASFLRVDAANGNATSRSFAGISLHGLQPFAAADTNVPGGQIWVGITRSTIRSVSITDYAGHVYTTSTTAAPSTTKTPYRYWALAVSGGAPAASLTTHDINGKTIVWQLRHGK